MIYLFHDIHFYTIRLVFELFSMLHNRNYLTINVYSIILRK